MSLYLLDLTSQLVMFTRQEASSIKHQFWTTFGRYMNPVPSAEGVKINWVNYRTGVKDVYFRMETIANAATIYISIEHSDVDIRQLYFEQFLELKSKLQSAVGEDWEWQSRFLIGDKIISRVSKELPGASVMDKNQWPDLISFFKPRIIGLDSFWVNAKYSFEALR